MQDGASDLSPLGLIFLCEVGTALSLPHRRVCVDSRCTKLAWRAHGKGSVNGSSVASLPPPKEAFSLPSRSHLLGNCPGSQECAAWEEFSYRNTGPHPELPCWQLVLDPVPPLGALCCLLLALSRPWWWPRGSHPNSPSLSFHPVS